jgi:hypothetical protein
MLKPLQHWYSRQRLIQLLLRSLLMLKLLMHCLLLLLHCYLHSSQMLLRSLHLTLLRLHSSLRMIGLLLLH